MTCLRIAFPSLSGETKLQVAICECLSISELNYISIFMCRFNTENIEVDSSWQNRITDTRRPTCGVFDAVKDKIDPAEMWIMYKSGLPTDILVIPSAVPAWVIKRLF